ncbi:MAG TPA: hypothetical protein P5228_00315 [Bacteroidales bacterium]|nr:hypothetical protein [Bacteroidales bacterium]HRZ47874.1 hypothetical protein [Bacteroidales bacterium]
MNQTFDIRRSFDLLKLNLHLNRKSFFLTLLGFFGFVFITSFFVANNVPMLLNRMHTIFYFILLYGGAALMGGSAFRILNRPDKSIAYLSLPASTFEKYLIPWLFTGIVWAIVSMVSYMAFALMINGLWSGVMQFPFTAFNPFEICIGRSPVYEAYMPYFLVHSIFFLGAAAFRKNAIPKTLLTGFILQSGFTFLNLMMMLILFGNFTGMDQQMKLIEADQQNLAYFFREVLPQLIKYSFAYVIPVIFYVAAFFKLKEREA